MVDSLKGLFESTFDYAGLFPPARLDMAKALENYIHLIEGPNDWMVGRFVISSDRLEELIKVIEQRPVTPEIPVTVIGQASRNYDEWQTALESDAGAMTDLIETLGESVALEAYEIRVPSHDLVDACTRDLKAFNEIDVFVEIPLTDGMDDSLAIIATTEWLGAKARTGGLDPTAIPSLDALAGFLYSTATLDIPFKLTAGLHHPLPYYDESIGAQMHGFLNALAGSAMAYTHDFSRKEIAEILRDDDTRHWSFDDGGMSWKGHKISLDDIEDVRNIFVGIGTCSIDEPLEGLAKMGLLGVAR